jgi:hypothetical protein
MKDSSFVFAADAATTRRTFIKVTTLAGAGFIVGCSESTDRAPAAIAGTSPPATRPTPAELNAFVKVGTDNTVTVIIKHLDKGQGVTTGLSTIVADELDAAWPQITWEFAPADTARYANLALGMQGTGGSSSISNSWMQYRQAGAAARAMLVAAAAERFGDPGGQGHAAALDTDDHRCGLPGMIVPDLFGHRLDRLPKGPLSQNHRRLRRPLWGGLAASPHEMRPPFGTGRSTARRA